VRVGVHEKARTCVFLLLVRCHDLPIGDQKLMHCYAKNSTRDYSCDYNDPTAHRAVCCNVLQCVAVCCTVLQCVAACCSVLQIVLQCVADCVAVCCRLCCSVLQCVVVCCSLLQIVLQCVMCCSALHMCIHTHACIHTCTHITGTARSRTKTQTQSHIA